MAIIIKIDGETVVIGLDDGGILEMTKSTLTFEPAVGDAVDIFRNEQRTIVTKKEDAAPNDGNGQEGGININMK
jgi:hypothetical protein